MTVWVRAAQRKNDPEIKSGRCEKEVKIGIWLDDRTLWLKSPRKRVGKVVQKLKENVDKVGWELDLDKEKWAASKRGVDTCSC